MEHTNHSVCFVFFVGMLCVFLDDCANASIQTEGKGLTEKTYLRAHFKESRMRTAIQRTPSHRRRSTKEQGDTGQADVCADIVGPNWQEKKQGKGPCSKLVVWVPKKTGFTELVEVKQSKLVDGFSIAIFCYALHALPFKVQPLFKPFINAQGESNGTYDQLLEQIVGKRCQAVVGDVTVLPNRAQYVDFAIPYLSSDVYLLVRGTKERTQTLWTFLRPFTWRLWITIICVCIYIGVVVAILEYRVGNPKFSAPFYRSLIMVIWLPISSFFFHEGKILNRISKVVLVMWLTMIFIVVQIFTATLSSWLTLDQLLPKASYSHVGYPEGSFVKNYLFQKFNVTGLNALPLNSLEEYKSALDNGKVDGIFDELPYIELFLAKYGSDDYLKFGPIHQGSGIAFAFPSGSRLSSIFSRAVIDVIESGITMEMKKKYLRFRNAEEFKSASLPQSLDVRSFIGLFVFMVIVTIVAIISSEFSIRREKTKNPSHGNE